MHVLSIQVFPHVSWLVPEIPRPLTLWPGKAVLTFPISDKEHGPAWVQDEEGMDGNQHLSARWRILGYPEWMLASMCILSSLRSGGAPQEESKSESVLLAFELSQQMQESEGGRSD